MMYTNYQEGLAPILQFLKGLLSPPVSYAPIFSVEYHEEKTFINDNANRWWLVYSKKEKNEVIVC